MNKKNQKTKKLKRLYERLNGYVKGSRHYNDVEQKIKTLENTAKK